VDNDHKFSCFINFTLKTMKLKLNMLLKVSTFTVLMLFSVLLFGQGSSWTAPPESGQLENPLSDDPTAWEKGKKIYDKLCWTCHGKLGNGDGPMSKSLDPKPAVHTSEAVQKQADGAIFWKISNGKGLMAPYENLLSKTERWHLVAYIRKLGEQ